jgi:hypothetical protein
VTAYFINPGTGPVDDATVDNAVASIKTFVADCGFNGGRIVRKPERDSDGRFGFDICIGDRHVEVDMPGCDPEVVRESRPFFSPRLYVNGSSWLWGYAVDSAAHHMNDTQ